MTFRSLAEFLDPKNGHAPTAAERQLIAATRAGEPCILSDTRPGKPSDETRIRAPLLRRLILGGTPDCDLHERGVALVGGWIEGRLDLAFCTARGQTVLDHCTFEAAPSFAQSRFQLLSLEDSAFPGLFAQGARIAGSLFLRRATATGTVDVNGAQIGGQLACEGAHFDGQGQRALNAQGVETGDSLFLSQVTALGTVDVNSAQIGGQLACEGAHFDGQGQTALNAQGVETGQDLFLRQVTALGTVAVAGAQIGGQLACTGARFDGQGQTALNAQRLRVTAGFLFRGLHGATGVIDLSAAHVSDLVDDASGWPQGPDQLRLDGFTYDRIDGAPPLTSFAARRAWLAAGSVWDGAFFPQPYTQLARVLRQMGHEGEARKVLIARTRLQGEHARAAREIEPNGGVVVGLRRIRASAVNLVHLAFDRASLWVAGYGHAPVRSLVWLLGLFVAAWIIADRTWATGAFAPNSGVILTSPGWAAVTAADCLPEAFDGCDGNPARTWANTFTASTATPTQGADWDSFAAPAYALDLVVPILDLGQTDAWAPSRDRGPWGWWLWWLRWLFESMGWLVSGLGIAAVTGVMQRNQPG